MNSRRGKLDYLCYCEGLASKHPSTIENQPGLSALVYRIGTYSSFKRDMLAALSRHKALRQLTTRYDDDFAIAMLDACAVIADVLTFYQERIANEGYLRTATERRSVLELARSIGYELKPGVAASTFLAFRLEDLPGSPRRVTIDIGTKVQSVPGQNELSQTFETIEKIEARAEWNELKPKMSQFKLPRDSDADIYIKGVSLNLKPGDPLLFVGEDRKQDPESDNWDFRRVKSAEINTKADHTKITLDKPLGSTSSNGMDTENANEYTEVYALRQRAALFGHNAPDWRAMPDSVQTGYLSSNASKWPGFSIKEISNMVDDIIYLDIIYPQILKNSWLVLSIPEKKVLYEIENVCEDSRCNFTLTAKTTRLTLKPSVDKGFDDKIRETVVFAQSELLELAETPLDNLVKEESITLDRQVDELTKGRILIVSGKNEEGKKVSEVVTISEIETLPENAPDKKKTKLTFTTELKGVYQRDSVTIYANVARATHGETVQEVLGGGNAGQANQSFILKQPPLTYISAPTATGAESTLHLRVNNLLWHEVPTLYSHGPDEQIYITRNADDGNTIVKFGDGKAGERLPSGQENLRATYRRGTGLCGQVKAGQLTLLMTRPLGLKDVTNPLDATGAEDPERHDQAKKNTPTTVLTLGRIVSVQDFEDFARTFAGIGKAQAACLWDGKKRFVHITIAEASGECVVNRSELYKSDLYENLVKAIKAASDSLRPFQIDFYSPLFFNVEAKVLVDQNKYIKDKVWEAITTALQDAFSFEKRELGQSVTKSEVLMTIHSVEGVEGVDLEKLYVVGDTEGMNTYLWAHKARRDKDERVPYPAELLTLNPNGINLMEMNL